jgi:hypothetical protein
MMFAERRREGQVMRMHWELEHGDVKGVKSSENGTKAEAVFRAAKRASWAPSLSASLCSGVFAE